MSSPRGGSRAHASGDGEVGPVSDATVARSEADLRAAVHARSAEQLSTTQERVRHADRAQGDLAQCARRDSSPTERTGDVRDGPPTVSTSPNGAFEGHRYLRYSTQNASWVKG
jgi:hypothetical protein